MDKSNGYESVAASFIERRGRSTSGTGASSVRQWARTLPAGATVLDLGCGTGLPITNVLIEEGLTVYGIDASPTLVKAFQQNFPGIPIVCEAVEESSFFQRQFDAIIAWGLLFLLPVQMQEKIIQRVGHALNTGGKFLFTAPAIKTEWVDVLTRLGSRSPGAATYRAWMSASGFALLEEFEDEGDNHYYHAVKL